MAKEELRHKQIFIPPPPPTPPSQCPQYTDTGPTTTTAGAKAATAVTAAAAAAAATTTTGVTNYVLQCGFSTPLTTTLSTPVFIKKPPQPVHI